MHGVVRPAYNAAETLPDTSEWIPSAAYDGPISGDDSSTDGTVTVARELGASGYRSGYAGTP